MNKLEQKNCLQTEAQVSDELSVEDLEDISGGIGLIPLIPLIPPVIDIVKSLFGGSSSGGSNRSSSTSRSSSRVENSGNSDVNITFNGCG